MNCTICKRPIKLVPSAIERAAKYGGTPAQYSRLFNAHADCQLALRKKQTSELMARKKKP